MLIDNLQKYVILISILIYCSYSDLY